MRERFGYRLVQLTLAIFFIIAMQYLIGSSSLFWVLIGVTAIFLAVPYLPDVIHKISAKGWLWAGCFVLLGLIPPTHLLMGPLPGPALVRNILFFLILFMPSAAVIMGAMLLYSGLTLQDTPRSDSRRLAALTFLVLALLLARVFYNLYWLMVWDSTYDALGILWLVIPLLAALFSAALLHNILPGKYQRAVWYGMLVPALMLAITAEATSTTFRQRTEAHGAQISQAIDAYARREGRYPQRLSQLVPRYTLALPQPVILYQQDWCYEAGETYYRLAYVDRAHWSSPDLFAHVYAEKGTLPPMPAPCGQEIQAIIQSKPEFYGRSRAP